VAEIVIFLVGALLGGVVGGQIVSYATECAHDCMPHNPKRCREHAATDAPVSAGVGTS